MHTACPQTRSWWHKGSGVALLGCTPRPVPQILKKGWKKTGVQLCRHTGVVSRVGLQQAQDAQQCSTHSGTGNRGAAYSWGLRPAKGHIHLKLHAMTQVSQEATMLGKVMPTAEAELLGDPLLWIPGLRFRETRHWSGGCQRLEVAVAVLGTTGDPAAEWGDGCPTLVGTLVTKPCPCESSNDPLPLCTPSSPPSRTRPPQ